MEELTRAKKKALMLLTDMDRSEKELYDKLKKAGFEEDVITETMDYVRSFGYINDGKYASKYIDAYSLKRSRQRIEYDLMRKGIAKELIAHAYEERESADERPAIRSIVAKRLKTNPEKGAKAAARMAGSLARQGFRAADVRSVLEEEGFFSSDGE